MNGQYFLIIQHSKLFLIIKRYFMLLTNETKVKLGKKYQKLLNVMNAYDDTFCMLAIQGHIRDCVVHFNKEGKILFQIVFDNIVDSFGMMTEREAIVLETRANFITIIQLDGYKVRRIPFNFLNEETDQSNIDTFSDSKYVVIREQGRFNDNRFKLSFFHHPLADDAKPFKVFFTQEHWTYQYQVRKSNNHSQYAWFKGRHDENFQFYIFDLQQSEENQIKKFTYPNRVGEQYGQPKVQCAMKNFWQLRKHEYMMVCDTDRNKPQGKAINNNYVVDTSTGVIRESKFRCRQPIFQDLIIQAKYMGPNSMFRTFNYENGANIPSPIYYIDNQTEEIVAQETWTCSYRNKYQFPGYDGSLLMDCMFENGDVDEVIVMAKKVMNPKEIVLHFMLELNPDFDRDLLQDVVEMIDYSK